MTNKVHYHVLIGLEGGYMPDTNHYCETLADALETAKFEKELSLDADMTVSGNIREDRQYTCQYKNASGNSLDTIIEIIECQEADCIEYADL